MFFSDEDKTYFRLGLIYADTNKELDAIVSLTEAIKRNKTDDKYYAKEIKALEIFNRDHLEHVNLIVFGQKEGTGMEAKDFLTDREEKIVLGVIQWLGTPVGQGFIVQLQER